MEFFPIELYKKGGMFCAYIGSDNASGYVIAEDTKAKCAKAVANYLMENGEWEDEDE